MKSRRKRSEARSRWIAPGILLLGALLPTITNADTIPDPCLVCHQYHGLSRYDAATDRMHLFSVNADYIRHMEGPHARLRCVDCHPRDEVAVFPHRPVSRVNCTQTCHLQQPGNVEHRFSHANVAEMLEQSAHTVEALTSSDFTGGPVLADGQSTCLYCHDEPVFRVGGQLPMIFQAHGDPPIDRCDVCHQEQIPTDTAYYLRHVLARLEPARPPLEQAQVCSLCHADAQFLEGRDMHNAVVSFVRSFHGKAALLGEGTAACTDCHVRHGENAHLMLGRSDPRSAVHPDHVANACRSTRCHPGADEALASAAVHLDLSVSRGTLEFGLAAAFIILTVLTFGPSLVLCLLELFQIVIGRHHHGGTVTIRLIERVLEHPEGRRHLKRFTVFQRYQHWVLAVLFILLALTGFPMKFADQLWSRALVDTFGGLAVARNIHHWAGLALVAGLIAHLVYCMTTTLRNVTKPMSDGRPMGLFRAFWEMPMLMRPSDLYKGHLLLLYLMGLRRQPPDFGRFTIKEKFEYIGIFWGTILMGITGIMLWQQQWFSHFVSGRVMNIALIAHTYEAFLAIIHVGILHIVNVMLTPHVFPLSLATITGDTPVSEMAHQHADYVSDKAADLGIAESGEHHG